MGLYQDSGVNVNRRDRKIGKSGFFMVFRVSPLDQFAVRVTTIVSYIGGFFMLPLLFAYLSNNRWNGLYIPTSFAILLAIFLLLNYASQPTAYRIDPEHLVVRRRWFWAVRVPLVEITRVSQASALSNVPHTGLRFAFNPGVFGYQGPFYLAPYGSAFFLATDRAKLVSVSRRFASPLILSPDKPYDFIDSIMVKLNEERVLAEDLPLDEPQPLVG